jgi:DNA polymerase III alpha subunit
VFVHLHVRSWFSFLDGGSSPESLVQRAGDVGQSALALTDVNGVYGAVRFQRACSQAGIKAIIGAEFNYRAHPLVLLARDQTGYANLCRLLTTYHVDPEGGLANADHLAGFREGLTCLSGGRRSYLWFLLSQGKQLAAAAWLNHLEKAFPGWFYVELVNNLGPGDLGIVRSACKLAAEANLPTVATNDVRFAEASAFSRYDLMCCARLGLTIHDPHTERPQNAEAYIKDSSLLRRR